MTFKGNDLSKVVNESYFSTYNSGAKKKKKKKKKTEESCNT